MKLASGCLLALLLGVAGPARAEDPVRSWTYVPVDPSADVPWRVVLVLVGRGPAWVLGGGPPGKEERLFEPSREWDERFEAALPVPRTKLEAIAMLRKVLSPEDLDRIRGMKPNDLIKLHHGFGTWLRNAFGLWLADSPLRDELGGGHPDSASTALIEAFWEDLQRDPAPAPAPR